MGIISYLKGENVPYYLFKGAIRGEHASKRWTLTEETRLIKAKMNNRSWDDIQINLFPHRSKTAIRERFALLRNSGLENKIKQTIKCN